jgi:hypothetical protein
MAVLRQILQTRIPAPMTNKKAPGEQSVSESRDYSLTGLDGQRAMEAGLAGAQWYAC